MEKLIKVQFDMFVDLMQQKIAEHKEHEYLAKNGQ